MMRISVIIPSRLQVNPNHERQGLWLDRALASVRGQAVDKPVEIEVVVGLDPGVAPPRGFANVRWAHGQKQLQAAAVNAAVAASTGDTLAFLEDDDWWMPS